MDALDHTIQSRAMLVAGVAVSVVIIVAIALAQTSGPREVTGDQAAYIDASTGPCSPERWVLACSRVIEAGWACLTGPGGVPVVAMDQPDKRGGHGKIEGRDVIGVAEHACGNDDPTPEHEIGHLLGLRDCKGCPIGDTMGTPFERSGMRFPRRIQ